MTLEGDRDMVMAAVRNEGRALAHATFVSNLACTSLSSIDLRLTGALITMLSSSAINETENGKSAQYARRCEGIKT